MEDGLGLFFYLQKNNLVFVLILVLMEDGLGRLYIYAGEDLPES